VLSGKSDIVILDDCLSALDAETNKKVFDAVLGPQGLMKCSTRILVTHATQYVAVSDLVMVFSNSKAFKGQPIFVGKPKDIETCSSTLKESSNVEDLPFLASLTTMLSSDYINELDVEKQSIMRIDDGSNNFSHSSISSLASLVRSKTKRHLNYSTSVKNLMTTEGKEEGVLSWRVIRHYFLLMGEGSCSFTAILMSLLVIERVFYAAADYWLALWTSATANLKIPFDFLPLGTGHSVFWVQWYIIISVIAAFLAYVRTWWIAVGGVNAAKALHDTLLTALLRSPVAFFETTPLGRVISRVSYDLQAIDYVLVARMNATVASAFWILSSVIVMMAVTPWITLLLVPVLVAYYFQQLYYRKSSIQIQRIDSTTRSPIQSCISEVITGTNSIRAYNSCQRFINLEDKHVDTNNRALVLYAASNRWMGSRLEFMGSFVTLASALLCWYQRTTISG
jgi:ABC-type multidrug transport system fused ATPase/permease subunit